eukprot:gene19110-22888_t
MIHNIVDEDIDAHPPVDEAKQIKHHHHHHNHNHNHSRKREQGPLDETAMHNGEGSLILDSDGMTIDGRPENLTPSKVRTTNAIKQKKYREGLKKKHEEVEKRISDLTNDNRNLKHQLDRLRNIENERNRFRDAVFHYRERRKTNYVPDENDVVDDIHLSTVNHYSADDQQHANGGGEQHMDMDKRKRIECNAISDDAFHAYFKRENFPPFSETTVISLDDELYISCRALDCPDHSWFGVCHRCGIVRNQFISRKEEHLQAEQQQLYDLQQQQQQQQQQQAAAAAAAVSSASTIQSNTSQVAHSINNNNNNNTPTTTTTTTTTASSSPLNPATSQTLPAKRKRQKRETAAKPPPSPTIITTANPTTMTRRRSALKSSQQQQPATTTPPSPVQPSTTTVQSDPSPTLE